ncbi:MAG: N-acetylmuramoyl-L-alanine amidase [Clostridiales bacterium]|jgi:N-acetylmuramoyl-L-alanine amidase|nr:N-acetylmuramoyl-L-alanine amidase [Clostridiales bacterium]
MKTYIKIILYIFVSALLCAGCSKKGETQISLTQPENTPEFYETVKREATSVNIRQTVSEPFAERAGEPSARYGGESSGLIPEELNVSKMYVSGTKVRFRAQPSTGGEIYYEADLGVPVTLLEILDDTWAKILIEDEEGYMALEFLSEVNPNAEEPAGAAENPNMFYGVKTESPPSADANRPKKIAIDAGHQLVGNSALEPIGPGAEEQKAKVSTGTRGAFTGKPEYELNLEVSAKLKDELIRRGYEVYMIRYAHDVDISNSERALMAEKSGADIFVRIHANGSENQTENGIMTISPTKNNPYIAHLYKESRNLSDLILGEMQKTTGANIKAIWETDTMSGINWSLIPVTIVEMGFMTNQNEDELMQTEEYQHKIAQGMANGIDAYFGKK